MPIETYLCLGFGMYNDCQGVGGIQSQTITKRGLEVIAFLVSQYIEKYRNNQIISTSEERSKWT